MSTDFQIAAPSDLSFERIVPTVSFNNVAPDVAMEQMGLGMQAQLDRVMNPDNPIEVNPELMQGVEDASYALQMAQLSGGSLLTDCLNTACTAMSNVGGVKQDIQPQQQVVTRPAPEELQRIWTLPSPNMMP